MAATFQSPKQMHENMSLLCQCAHYVSIHITYNWGATSTILSAVVADPEPILFIYLFIQTDLTRLLSQLT